jgi:hypothetical protein
MGAGAVKTWRCAICKVTGEAADARLAERQMVEHWRQCHFNVRGTWKERDARPAAES